MTTLITKFLRWLGKRPTFKTNSEEYDYYQDIAAAKAKFLYDHPVWERQVYDKRNTKHFYEFLIGLFIFIVIAGTFFAIPIEVCLGFFK